MSAAPLPYVGPRALLDGEVLYGRTQEVEDLLDLLVANRVALLYSPSGAGKTSLINAGLLPRLRDEGFTVAPIARIDRPPAPTTGATTPANRFTDSLLASLGVEPASATGPDVLGADETPGTAEERLTGLLQTRAAEDLVIVLDQFETLFTLDPADRASKVAFMTLLGELVSRRTMAPVTDPAAVAQALDPRPWLLIVLREEFLAALDPYRHLVPGGLDARMRLELLDPERARVAIQGPAAASGVTIDDAAARALADDLCAIQETDEDGTVTTVPGPTVEPVQLQVTCLRLWLQLQPERGATIRRADLPAASGVNEALGAYYAESVAAIGRQTGASELVIRDWFGGSLIVQLGGRSIRAQVRDGVSPAVRSACEDAHLVRGDERSGVRWYELAHDRLVTPIIEDNARWLREHARPLLLRARAWEAGGRDPMLLLRGKDLKDAKAVAASATDLTALERELVAASEEAGRSARRGRQVMIIVGSLSIAVAVLVVALAALRIDGERKAKAGRLAVMAERQIPWVASVQRYVAAELSGGSQPLLAATCECVPQLERAMLSTTGRIWSVAFAPDDGGVLWGQVPGPLLSRRLDDSLVTPLVGAAEVGAMAWAPDRAWLAIGDEGGRVLLVDPSSVEGRVARDVTTGAIVLPVGSMPPPAGPTAEPSEAPGATVAPPVTARRVAPPAVTAIAWSADGSTIAATFGDGRLLVWRVEHVGDETVVTEPVSLAASWLHLRLVRVALSDDGRYVAATEAPKGAWAVWRLEEPDAPQRAPGAPAGAVAFLPGTPMRLLVAGGREGIAVMRIQDLPPPVYHWGVVWDGSFVAPGSVTAIRDLAVYRVADGGAVVGVARGDGIVQVVSVDDAGEWSAVSQRFVADRDAAEHVTWSSMGDQLAATGRSGSLAIWSIPVHRGRAPSDPVPLAVLLSPDGGRLSVASDGRITRSGPGGTPFVQPASLLGSTYQAAAIAPDGATVALAGDGQVVVVRDGAEAPVILDHAIGDTTGLAFSPDSTRLAVATTTGVVTWRLTGVGFTRLAPDISFPEPNANAPIAWDASGTGLFVGRCEAYGPLKLSCEQGAVVWYPVDGDPAGGGPRRSRRVAVEGWPWSLASDPRDPAMASVGLKNGRVYLIDVPEDGSDASVVRSTQLTDDIPITRLAYATDGEARLAVGARSGRVLLVDPKGLGVVAENVGGAHAEVTALAYSTDGSRIAIGPGPWPHRAEGGQRVDASASRSVDGTDDVQVVELADAALRERVCQLATWMTPGDEKALLLGQSRPTCR